MKNSKIPILIACGLLALTIQSRGQSTTFQVTFKGNIVTTNANGNIISQKLSNRSFIQDAQTATGATNSSSFKLVYVQNASTDPSAPADFVEVIGGTNETPVYTNLQFMYSGSSFPPALTNSAQTQIAIGAGIIPQPLATGDSLGWATINERIMTKKTVINGSFNFTSLRSAGSNFNDTVRIYSGSFNVGKQIATP